MDKTAPSAGPQRRRPSRPRARTITTSKNAPAPAGTVARQAQGPFHHRAHQSIPSRRAAFKEALWFIAEHGPWRRARTLPPSRASQPLPRLEPGQTRLSWVGHATVVVETGGKTILTDPLWSKRINGFIRRLRAPGLELEHVGRVDCVVVSHNHYDHLDWPTIQRLPRTTTCVVPLGLGAAFRRRGFADVRELDWWEATHLEATPGHAPVTVELVPAHHWSRRSLWDLNASLWGGFVIHGAGRKVYFSGDTAYGTAFRDIAGRHPDIDVAVLPIGAYEPRELNALVHTSPEEALQAFVDLGARHMLPVHWGTFRLSPEPVAEPMMRLHQAWDGTGLETTRLWAMPAGGSRTLPATVSPQAAAPLQELAVAPTILARRRVKRARTAS